MSNAGAGQKSHTCTLIVSSDEDWEPRETEGWKPPTEAEMKVLQARRERSDKISKLMGAYLLKGYKMLGTSCGTCGTILLRSKQDVDYCVACGELETDTVKDDPALNQEAARKQAAEQSQRELQVGSVGLEILPALNGRLRTDSDTCYSNGTGNTLPLRGFSHQGASGQTSMDGDDKPFCSVSDLPPTEMSRPAYSEVQSRTPIATLQGSSVNRSVQDKMVWASTELAQSQSVEYSKNVCELIKTCAETLVALNALQSGKPNIKEENN